MWVKGGGQATNKVINWFELNYLTLHESKKARNKKDWKSNIKDFHANIKDASTVLDKAFMIARLMNLFEVQPGNEKNMSFLILSSVYSF